MTERIAVLGMGAMGSRMAGRLLDAGHDVAVWNRTPARADALRERGATVAETPRGAAEGRAFVIACVRDDEASRAVWTDPATGALGAMAKDAVAVESSTVTPSWVRDLAARAEDVGVRLLDAPVAGSRPQAEAGQLVYLLGGDDGTVARSRPVLDGMGGAFHHVGPAGAGAVMKLVVNAYFGIQIAAMGELLGFASRGGIAVPRATEVLGELPVTSPALKGVAGLIAAGRYTPMFPVELVEKDFGYVEAAAEAVGADVPTARTVRALYGQARDAGYGDENIHAVAKLFDGGTSPAG